jgi:hypothetical protein
LHFPFLSFFLFVSAYKLRTRIAKALQSRSEAIRKALTKYNTEAAKLSPPCPKLSWNQIVDYGFLAEFDLLRYARNDIRTQDWTDPAWREATIKYLQLRGAHGEIKQLNIEIRRLRTAIHNEKADMEKAIATLSSSNPPLAAELRRRWQLRSSVNMVHLGCLDQIEALHGFSGIRGIGTWVGRQVDNLTNIDAASTIQLPADKVVEEVLAPELDMLAMHESDELLHDIVAVTNFVTSIND